MNWKLGVAMSSSSCRSLSTPYISLQLRMSESAGTTQLRSFEMTVPEFQVINIKVLIPPDFQAVHCYGFRKTTVTVLK